MSAISFAVSCLLPTFLPCMTEECTKLEDGVEFYLYNNKNGVEYLSFCDIDDVFKWSNEKPSCVCKMKKYLQGHYAIEIDDNCWNYKFNFFVDKTNNQLCCKSDKGDEILHVFVDFDNNINLLTLADHLTLMIVEKKYYASIFVEFVAPFVLK